MKADEVDRILAQNDEIESQIEKLQEKQEQSTEEINQALADSIEKQEKMHADAEAFWQASGARSKIFGEDETTAKQAEKELEKAQEKMDQAEKKQKTLRKNDEAIEKSEKSSQKLDELDSQKLAPIQAQLDKLQKQAERNLRRFKEIKQEMEEK